MAVELCGAASALAEPPSGKGDKAAHAHKHGAHAHGPKGHAHKEKVEQAPAQAADKGGQGRREAAARAREARQQGVAAMKAAREASSKGDREAARAQMRQARQELKEARKDMVRATQDGREGVPSHVRAADTPRAEAWKALQERGKRRIHAARKRAWARWQGRIKARGGLDVAVRAEFKHHARRTARLRRIVALASSKGDDKAVARATKLLSREQARHEAKMAKLVARPAGAAEAADKAPKNPAAADNPQAKAASGKPDTEVQP